LNQNKEELIMKRPFGVTILAILSGILTVYAAINALQWLGFFPWLGPGPGIRTFSLWYALMYGLLAWVYLWLTKMLWDVEEVAWLFLAVISIFNLTLNFVALVGRTAASWEDVALSTILNGLILIYIMLPGVRKAFGRS
jgi:hypothetical protein